MLALQVIALTPTCSAPKRDGTVSTKWSELVEIRSASGPAPHLLFVYERITPASAAKSGKGRRKSKAAGTDSSACQHVLAVHRVAMDVSAKTIDVETVARHELTPPTADSSDRVVSVALNKGAGIVSMIWASGHWQGWQFPLSRHKWYTHAPSELVARKVNADESDDDSEADRHDVLASAEPGCVLHGRVHAEEATSPELNLAVWDARYGVDLGVVKASAKTIRRPDGDDSSAAAEVSTNQTPTLVALTVGWKGTCVAAALSNGVVITVPAAKQDANLGAALGRLKGHSRAEFAVVAGDGSSVPGITVVADMQACLTAWRSQHQSPEEEKRSSRKRKGSAPEENAAAAIVAWKGDADAAVWAKTLQDEDALEAATIAALTDTSTTATAEAFTKQFQDFIDAGDAAEGGKRKKQATSSGVDSGSGMQFPSQRFILAVMERCLAELRQLHAAPAPKSARRKRRQSVDGSVDAIGLDLREPLRVLLRTKRVSATSCPDLIPTLLESNELDLLEDTVVHVSDIPEPSIVGIFKALAASISDEAIEAFAASKGTDGAETTTKGKGKKANAQAAALSGDSARASVIEHFL